MLCNFNRNKCSFGGEIVVRDELIFFSDSPGNRVHVIDVQKGKVNISLAIDSNRWFGVSKAKESNLDESKLARLWFTRGWAAGFSPVIPALPGLQSASFQTLIGRGGQGGGSRRLQGLFISNPGVPDFTLVLLKTNWLNDLEPRGRGFGAHLTNIDTRVCNVFACIPTVRVCNQWRSILESQLSA